MLVFPKKNPHHTRTGLKCLFFFSKENKGEEWRNFYTSEKVDLNYGVDFLDGGASGNCGFMDPRWKGWRDFMCSRDFPVTCACEHPGQMYLQLRGLCPDSNLDKFYVPRNQEGAVILIGLKTSLISYDKVDMIAMCV